MAESNREEIAKLEALYANNPGGRVFTHLAEAYRKAGELDRAREILEDGITRHAEYASAHVVLGRVLQDQGAREEAAAAFGRVLELDPENRVALRSLGDLARESHRYEQAIAYFRQLLALDPTDDQLVRTIEQLNAAVHAGPAEEAPAPVAGERAPASETAEAGNAAGEADVAPAEAGTPFVAADTAEAAVADDAANTSQAFEPEFPVSSDPSEFSTEELPDAGLFIDPNAGAPWVEPTAEPLLPPDPAAADMSPASGSDESAGEFVTPDFSLDWDVATPEAEEPGLPGDLAAFAEAAAPLPAADDAESADAVNDVLAEIGEFVDVGEPAGQDEPTFEAQLSSMRQEPGVSEPESGAPGLQAELQTETLAELYVSQGFYDRAADVYRSLLDRSPDNDRLRRRLEEVEARAAEVGSTAAGGEEPEALDPFWTGAESTAPEAMLYAWEPESEEPIGPTVRTFFSQLLSWRPSAGDEPPVQAAEPSAFVEAAVPAGEAGEPDTATEEVVTDDLGTGVSAFEEVEAPKDTEALVAQEAASADAQEPSTAVPHEEPAPPAGPGLLSQFSAPLNEVEAAFEEWFSGVPAAPAGAPSTPSVSEVGTEEPPAPAPPASAAAPEATSAQAGPSSEDSEDDEDLEMFRSWLQSLKR